MTWRVGTKVGRTVYDGDTLIGVMDTPELAARVVDAVNAACPVCHGERRIFDELAMQTTNCPRCNGRCGFSGQPTK